MGLYAAGMTTRDISEQIKNLYDVEISAEMVSNITSRILPIVTEWQSRPLEKTYPFIFIDDILSKECYNMAYINYGFIESNSLNYV